jgi:hypothetical protein
MTSVPLFVARTTWWQGPPINGNGTTRPLLARPVPTLTAHYTGSPISVRASTDTAEVWLARLQAIALRAGKSFEYNYVIPPRMAGAAAEVWEYAGLYQAAHSSGENSISIGVLFAIGVNNHPSYSTYDPTQPTVWEPISEQMIDAYRWLRDVHLADVLRVPLEQRQHNQMPGAATSCPGESIISRWSELLAPCTPPVPPPVPPPEEPVTTILIDPVSPTLVGLFTLEGQPVSPEAVAALKAAGPVVTVVQDHPWWDEATRHKMGEVARRLYNDTPGA